jgi:hypothetical protein
MSTLSAMALATMIDDMRTMVVYGCLWILKADWYKSFDLMVSYKASLLAPNIAQYSRSPAPPHLLLLLIFPYRLFFLQGDQVCIFPINAFTYSSCTVSDSRNFCPQACPNQSPHAAGQCPKAAVALHFTPTFEIF